jgi:hypothetical protein
LFTSSKVRAAVSTFCDRLAMSITGTVALAGSTGAIASSAVIRAVPTARVAVLLSQEWIM